MIEITGKTLGYSLGNSVLNRSLRNLPPPDVEKRPYPTYARVITGNVPIYQDPLHASQGLKPIRSIDAGYVWVTLADSEPIPRGAQRWYAINEDEHVQADYLEIYQPSEFQGLSISTPKTFAWMVFDAWTAPGAGEMPGDDSILLERYTIVTIDEEQMVEDRKWYRVGKNQWV